MAGPMIFGKREVVPVAALLQPDKMTSTTVQQLLLYAGLKWENPKLKVEDVADLMDQYYDGELDGGEKYMELVKTISTGINQAVGIDINFQKKPGEMGEGEKPPDLGIGEMQ